MVNSTASLPTVLVALCVALAACNGRYGSIQERVNAENATIIHQSRAILDQRLPCCENLLSTPGIVTPGRLIGNHLTIRTEAPVREFDGDRSFFQVVELPRDPRVTKLLVMMESDSINGGQKHATIFCPSVLILNESGEVIRKMAQVYKQFAAPYVPVVELPYDQANERFAVLFTMPIDIGTTQRFSARFITKFDGGYFAQSLPENVVCNNIGKLYVRLK